METFKLNQPARILTLLPKDQDLLRFLLNELLTRTTPELQERITDLKARLGL